MKSSLLPVSNELLQETFTEIQSVYATGYYPLVRNCQARRKYICEGQRQLQGREIQSHSNSTLFFLLSHTANLISMCSCTRRQLIRTECHAFLTKKVSCFQSSTKVPVTRAGTRFSDSQGCVALTSLPPLIFKS